MWIDAEKDLATHILQHHPEKIRIGDSHQFTPIIRRQWIPHSVTFIYAFNRIFRAFWQVDSVRGSYKFAVNIMEKSAQEKYSYTLVILPYCDYRPTFIFNSECFGLRKDERWIYPGQSAVIHYNALKGYFNSEKKLCYIVTIKKNVENSTSSTINATNTCIT